MSGEVSSLVGSADDPATHRAPSRRLLLAVLVVVSAAVVLGGSVPSGQEDGPVQVVLADRTTAPAGSGASRLGGPAGSAGAPTQDPELDGVDWIDAGAPCLLGRKLDALTTGWDWFADVVVGPASSPVVDSAWVGADSGRPYGVWSIAVSKARMEVHVPGLTVVDLVGERTEEIELGPGRPATLWFTDDWVQLRFFPAASGPDPGPCDSFTVSVTGADESTNRAGAIVLASSIVIAERGAPTPPPTVPPTATTTATAGSADGSPLDRTG